MHLFYTPDIVSTSNHYVLNEEESKHAIKVLRLTQNAEIQLTDGVGGWYTCVIEEPDSKKCRLLIKNYEAEYRKPIYNLHLAIAPTKNIDRMEWLLEKATEIGIHQFTPIISSRSERKEVKLERLEKIAISAMKQSFSAYKPIVNPVIRLNDFLNKHKDSNLFIAHCLDGDKKYLNKIYLEKQDCIILIGPEGDFTDLEIESAKKLGSKEVTFGNQRLRTETAGLMAVVEINLLNR